MASKASVLPAVKAHYDTLRDARTGSIRKLDYVLFAGVPIALGGGIWWIGFRLNDIGSVLAGLAVFTALLFGLVIFVFQLRIQIKDDGRDRDRPRLAEMVDETFSNVTYSVIVGIITTTCGLIAAGVADTVTGAPVWISAVLVALSTHLLLTILMCLKRIHSAYQQLKV